MHLAANAGTSSGWVCGTYLVPPPTLSTAFGGTVTDTCTTLPVPDASVQWGSYSTTTDSSGNYSFTNLPCQTNPLTVSKSGYQTHSESYTPTCNASNLKDVPLTCNVSNVASFGGTVTDSCTTLPIAGAAVQWGSYSTTTDGSGTYSFTNLPCQTNPLTVSKSGYQTHSESYTPTCNAMSTKDVQLQCIATIVIPLGSTGMEIRGDTAVTAGPNAWRLSGNVEVGLDGNWLLGIQAPKVLIDLGNETITSSGQIQTQVPLPVFPLYAGSFSLEWTSGKLAMISSVNQGFSAWSPGGLNFRIGDLALTASPAPGVSLEGTLTLPPQLASAEVSMAADFTAAGVALSAAKACLGPEQIFNVQGSSWAVQELCMTYDAATETITGLCTVDLQEFVVDGTIVVKGGALETVAVDLSGLLPLAPPVPALCSPTAFGLTTIGGKVQNLSQPGVLVLEGTLGFAAVAESACFLPGYEVDFVSAEPLTFRYDLGGRFSFQGEADLFVPDPPIQFNLWSTPIYWEGYPLAAVSAQYEQNEGFVVQDAWLDLFDVVKGRVDHFSIDPNLRVLGSATGWIQVPSGFPAPFGGLQLAGASAVIDDEALWACADAFGVEVCVVFYHAGTAAVVVNWSGIPPAPALPGSASQGTTFYNAQDGAALLIGVEWGAGTDDFLLTSPSGTSYLSSTVAPGGPVTYYQDAAGGLGVFTAHAAEQGTWTISPMAGTVAPTYFGWQQNVGPVVQLVSAPSNLQATAGTEINVAYDAFDPDDAAKIRFYVSEDYTGLDGRPLETSSPVFEADGPGVAPVTIPADLRPGEYFLHAEISDGVNLPARSDALIGLRVLHPQRPASPDKLTYLHQGPSVVVRVHPPVTAAGNPASFYRLVYARSDGSAPAAETTFDATVGQVSLSAADGLAPGVPYTFRAIPVDAAGDEGEPSEFILAPAPSAGTNAPTITQVPGGNCRAGAAWSTFVRAADPDGTNDLDLVVLAAENPLGGLPPGLSWTPTVSGEWRIDLTPQVGGGKLYAMTVTVDDSAGNRATYEWLLNVLALETGNASPRIVSKPPQIAKSSSAYVYQVAVSDPDEVDGHTVRLLSMPTGMTEADGAISWTPPTNGAGVYDIVVEVTDGFGARTTQAFSLFVDPQAAGGSEKSKSSGGGGCVIDPDGVGDPLFAALLAGALLMTYRRRGTRSDREAA